MARFVCVTALLAAACTSPNASLADLPDLRVGVIVDREIDTDGDYSTRPSKVSGPTPLMAPSAAALKSGTATSRCETALVVGS